MKKPGCVCLGFNCLIGSRAINCHPYSMGFFSKSNPSNPDGPANNQPDNSGSCSAKKAPANSPCSPPGNAGACPAPKKKTRKPRAKCGKCARLAKKKSKLKKCGKKAKKRPMPRSNNAFMIYFLEQVRRSRGKKKVTEVAKEAGQAWCSMTVCDKMKYKKIAEREKIRLRKCMKKK